MNSIRDRFTKFQALNPNASDFICFGNAIKGRNYTKNVIRTWFNKLVDPQDYKDVGKRISLNHFYGVSEKNNPKMHHDKKGLKCPNLRSFGSR